MPPSQPTSESTSRSEEGLIQYLLGRQPEGETEHIEALLFADPDFAEALSATEENLVDTYINGELTGATRARFESHYLASPARRERVEFARAFHDFAERFWAGQTPGVAVAPAWWVQSAAGI